MVVKANFQIAPSHPTCGGGNVEVAMADRYGQCENRSFTRILLLLPLNEHRRN